MHSTNASARNVHIDISINDLKLLKNRTIKGKYLFTDFIPFSNFILNHHYSFYRSKFHFLISYRLKIVVIEYPVSGEKKLYAASKAQVRVIAIMNQTIKLWVVGDAYFVR